MKSPRAPKDEPDGVESCAACGAVQVGESTFCEECGEPLVDDAPARAGLTRKEAATDMRRAMGRIRRLKTFLAINVVLALLGTLGLVAVLLRSEGLAGSEIAVYCVLQLAILGLSYAAYRYVDRKPFPIVLALAAFQTLSVILSYLNGNHPLVGTVFALILWWLVTDAAYAAKIAKQHPDLYAAKRMRGENISHKKKGGRRYSTRRSATDHSEVGTVRQRAAGRGSADTNWWVLGGVLLGVLALGVAGFKASQKSSSRGGGRSLEAAPAVSPRGVIEAFRLAWNSHDIDAIGQLTKESLQDKIVVTLGRLGDRYEWGDEFPQLESAVFDEPKKGEVRVKFPSEAGDFPVRFVVENGDWVLRSLTASPLKDWRP